MISWMKKANSFKFSFRVLRSFCLIFCQFQPGVASKNVASKKACIIKYPTIEFNDNFFISLLQFVAI